MFLAFTLFNNSSKKSTPNQSISFQSFPFINITNPTFIFSSNLIIPISFIHHLSHWIATTTNYSVIIVVSFSKFSQVSTMGARFFSVFLAALSIALTLVSADPEPLQDLCVADLTSSVKVNGFPCKSNATADDFFTSILAAPAATNNTMGATVTGANVMKVPGLNTLGVSLSRIDYAVGGLNPPHTHPRATEVVFVLEGELEVGFITTANVLVSKTIKKGDVFAFPIGLVHFQKNSGKVPAAVISAFDSQLPGTVSIGATLFAAKPEVPDYVLTKAFQIGTKEVDKIKSRFAPKK